MTGPTSTDGARWSLSIGSSRPGLELSGIVGDGQRLVRVDRQLSYARQVRSDERAKLVVLLPGGRRRTFSGGAGEVLACLCEVFQGRLPSPIEKSNKKR